MSLDQNAINELKQIHLEETGEALSDEEAWDMGLNLVKLLGALSRGARPKRANLRDNLTGGSTSS